uniref:TIP41-like protein n=1 Tax=Panagrolaimus sp. JU765 TaxID=591449 RepID=A0AC34QIW3_9BILA
MCSTGSGGKRLKDEPEKVMERAQANARVEERFRFDETIDFFAIRDHILPSTCRHADDIVCQVCKFNELELPQLPEMIFPNNKLVLKLAGSEDYLIEFNAYDALKQVDAKTLPDVEVGPSAVWKEARKAHIDAANKSQPFDWTFTSNYAGTIGPNVKMEETSMTIDIEKLKRRDPIHFYSQLTLYEDELADHGCAHMAVRLRVMPTAFFVLCRFYLRVDNVFVRTCDTRLFGELDSNFILREWTKREALYSDLDQNDRDNVHDENLIWQSLPIIDNKSWKIFLE